MNKIKKESNLIFFGIFAVIAIVLTFLATFGINTINNTEKPKNLAGKASTKYAESSNTLNSVNIENEAFIKDRKNLLADTFDVYMSSTPSNILAANPISGNQRANLLIVGTSQTNPVFTVKAQAIYDDIETNGIWSIKNVVYSKIPPGYTKPEIISDNSFSFSEYNVPYVVVKSGGKDTYRMTWRILGTATSDIKPVLLPRWVSFPWNGNKHGWVVKARETIDFNPDDAPYGTNNSNLINFFAPLIDVVKNMSNGAVKMDYNIKEAYFDPIHPPCTGMYNSDIKVPLQNLSINNTNYREHYDWLVYTMYKAMQARWSSCIAAQGMFPYKYYCPQCGPGALYSDINNSNGLNNGMGSVILQHEIGHGIGLGDHPHINLCPSTPSSLNPQDIFALCSQYATSPENMGGAGKWWNPIDRATLGWLKGSQVTLVTKSGLYDVYSDNVDYTSDPKKQLVLQILVNLNGQSDFVYITVPSITNINGLVIPDEGKVYYSRGIQLSAGRDEGMRYGMSRVSIGLILYSNWHNSNNITEKVIKNTIQPGEEVHLNWTNTNIKIRNIQRNGDHAKVEVKFL